MTTRTERHLERIATPLLVQRETWDDPNPWAPAPFLYSLDDLLVDACLDPLERFIIVEAPVRHGKSQLTSRALQAWHMGMFPQYLAAQVGYNDNFAKRWGGQVRTIMRKHGKELWDLELDPQFTAVGDWKNNKGGGMISVGRGGELTGLGYKLIVVDDPIKNIQEANSELIRKSMAEWFYSTVDTRLEPGGTVVVTMARWHHDDLIGNILSQDKGRQWERFRFPAIAELPKGKDSATWRDELGRVEGEALWPERYPLRRLDQIRNSPTGKTTFNALYQQNPVPAGGDDFKVDKWMIDTEVREPLADRVRYWDLAATAGGGDYTVGALLARGISGQVYVTDVVRGQWHSSEVEVQVIRCARQDGVDVRIRMEQESGGSGKAVIASYARRLAGYDFAGTGGGKKHFLYAAAQGNGVITVLRREWTDDFIEEHRQWPKGRNDDMVDAAGNAFIELTKDGEVTISGPDPSDPLADAYWSDGPPSDGELARIVSAATRG